MTQQADRSLEKQDSWDWETAEMVRPSKRRRTIVSVAFSPHHFRTVAECAARLRMPVSTFIREAALDKATTEQVVSFLMWSTGNRGYAEVPVAQSSSTETSLVTRRDPCFETAFATG